MYTRFTCPHCEKNSFAWIQTTSSNENTGPVLKRIDVSDTLKEEDLVNIVSKFVSENIEEGTQPEDLKAILNRCLGISPQFTEELVKKSAIKKKCKKSAVQH